MTPRRRRIYLTIIAIGLVLVAIDRLYIQDGSAKLGPQSAQASAHATERARQGAAESGFARIWVPPVSLEVPKVWRELAEQADTLVRQPFGGGRPLAESGLAEMSDDAPDQSAASATKFEDRHRLEGILSSPSRPRAIIDGRVVTIGETIDGLVIEEIDTWRVRLRGSDGIVTLVLPSEMLDERPR